MDTSGVGEKLRLIIQIGAASKKWKKFAGRSRDRYYRFRELVTTQEDYRKDLISIREKIRAPLIANDCISEAEAGMMFPGVEAMIGLSLQLGEELGAKLQSWDRRTTTIGQAMIRFSKFLLVYSEFFKNFNESQRRLKELLTNNEKAREIQRALNVGGRLTSFEDLMSKPFQRPLKYHLILRDYASKTDQTHVDWPCLQQAIACYHKVNEQNNLALQNKEKDQRLLALDARFGDIIDGQARYFVGQHEAVCIDRPVSVYLFSDLLLLAERIKDGEKQLMRIDLDSHSYVALPADGIRFRNRLFVYGRRICAHLVFNQRAQRDTVRGQLIDLISAMSKNETNREEMMVKRRTRLSVLERRRSYTQLEPQFKRPMIATVPACERRQYGPESAVVYFVIQFHPTPARWDAPTPRQTALVTEQKVIRLEQLARNLYGGEFPSINSRPKGLDSSQQRQGENSRLELEAVFLQLSLNTLFRNPQILKRIDIFAHLLSMSEPIWSSLRFKICTCPSCSTSLALPTIDSYFQQRCHRTLLKSQSSTRIFSTRRKEFCDLRTLQMQNLLAQMPGSQLVKASSDQRIVWVKSSLGWINYSMTTSRPTFKKLSFAVNFCGVFTSQRFEMEFPINVRAKQVVDFMGLRMGFNMEDFALVAHIGPKAVVLMDDDLLSVVLERPKKEEGFFGLFKKDDYRVQLYVRKMWVLEYTLESNCQQRKLGLLAQEIVYRLRWEELKVGDVQSQVLYALYYAYRHFIELDTLSLNLLKVRTDQFNKMLPSRLRSSEFLQKLSVVLEKIRKDKSVTKPSQLAAKMVDIASTKPGWSCWMFEAEWRPQGIRVLIGCDLRGIRVRERNKSLVLFEFAFGGAWSCETTGGILRVREQRDYCFWGSEVWKVKQLMQFYRHYRTALNL